MALKGIDYFKLSPKKNCKECGFPTCMAFCMKVAQGAKSLDLCPYFSPEAKEKLSAQSEPPMKTISVGDYKLGGETVLFRHEKTLVNKNLYAICVGTCQSEQAVDAKLAEMQKIDYERIGERMYVEFVSCTCTSSATAEEYAALVKKAAATGRTLILNCRSAAAAKAALAITGKNAILNGATPENWAAMNVIAKEAGVPLGVRAENLSDLYDTVQKLEGIGNKNLILDITGKNAKETLRNAVLVRRTALKDGDRSFGYPSIVNVAALARGDSRLQTAYAALFTEKYASIIVMERMTYAQALPLYGLRQNIYTDPQKPMKVASGIYPINGADENSPCVLTVDFALTYFLVAGELERSGQPVNLVIADASGMSVLTAWAAGKLSASSIKKDFEALDIEEKIKNRTLIIPGKVSVMKDEIQEKLLNWNVVTGPQEAVQLPRYMKEKEYEAEAKAAEMKRASMNGTSEGTRELTFEELLETRVPKIEIVDMGVRYKGRRPDAKNFVVIGERIHCIAPSIRKAMDERDPAPILKRAAEQIVGGATYLDVNIGPAEKDGPERMMWAVKLLQENFNNVPLALDTANKRAIEAGIRVYNRTNGKPIINSADAGSRIGFIDLAAANDAICIALCSADGIARDNEERMIHCDNLLERGLKLGMTSDDIWFDPQFLVVKGMQDKQMEILEAIKMISDKGLKSTGGISNNSNGAPKAVRPVMDSALIAMCMMQGLTSAIVNPNDRRLMETIRSCDIFKNNVLYSDSYLDI